MKASVENVSVGFAQPVAVFEHNGGSVRFLLSAYNKSSMSDDLLYFLSSYWQTMPVYQIDYIFSRFVRIREILDASDYYKNTESELYEELAMLLDIYNIDDMITWVSLNREIIFPVGINDVFVADIDLNITQNRTYVRKEYVGLIAMTLIFRTCVPILSEYIHHTKKAVGTDFKEFQAFMMVRRSKLFSSEPFLKLSSYINETIKDDEKNEVRIIEGISSEDFPDWLIAKTFVRKLAICPINNKEDSKVNLVTYVFKFVKQQVTGGENSSGGDVYRAKDNLKTSLSLSDDEQQSYFDSYKRSSEFPYGVIVELQVALSQTWSLASRVQPGIDLDELDKKLGFYRPLLLHKPLHDAHIILMSWFFAGVITPRSFFYVERSTLIDLLVLTHFVLWERGFKTLALFCLSYKMNTKAQVINMSSKTRLSKTVAAELDTYFPYHFYTSNSAAAKPENPAVISIDILSDLMLSNKFIMTVPSDQIKSVYGESFVSKVFNTPLDIKTVLGEFIVDVQRRRAENALSK